MGFTVDTRVLREIAESFGDPAVDQKLRQIAGDAGIVAIISQAVADNFDKEGPGWKPLAIKTIKRSVAKELRGRLKGMTDEQIREEEAKVRAGGDPNAIAFRRILQKTGLLKLTATTRETSSVSPGPTPNIQNRDQVSKKITSGSNIYRVEGTNIIYGTDLVYAKTHNQGDSSRNIEARPFLVIRKEWMADINEFWVTKARAIIAKLKGVAP